MSALVVFIGGFQASKADVEAWARSAKDQEPDIDVRPFFWPPGASSGADSAVAGFTNGGKYDALVAEIKASSASPIYIVGHSSGCAIANAVDRGLGLKDYRKIVLVALDGFAPDGNQRGRSSTQVWAAECGKTISLNHKKLENLVGDKLNIYQATDCNDLWPLHFSLVNANAKDGVVKGISTGYADCRANLIWMQTKP